MRILSLATSILIASRAAVADGAAVLTAAAAPHAGEGVVALEVALAAPPGERLRVEARIDGAPVTLDLARRWHRAPGFRVLVDDGGPLRAVAAPAVATYRGAVVGRPDRRVAAAVGGGRLRAVVAPAAVQPAAGGGLFRTQIAFDADFEFFSLNGQSVPATVADIESIMNVVTMVYEAEVGITYAITSILVRTFEPDPYTGNDALALFQQFRTQWNSQHEDVPRDVAHLMTGRALAGGIIGLAGQGVICDLPNAYSMSRSRFFDDATQRVILTAHLLGHNWNATDCSDEPDCSIMCGPLGDCPGEPLTFGKAATAQIVEHRDSRDCLDGPCAGDVDGDGDVGFDDVLLVLAAWGQCRCAEDLDDDGDVDFDDLLLVLAHWGACW